MKMPFSRPRLRVIEGGRTYPVIRARRRSYETVRRYNAEGQAVYLSAIIATVNSFGGGVA